MSAQGRKYRGLIREKTHIFGWADFGSGKPNIVTAIFQLTLHKRVCMLWQIAVYGM